jgi:hypothetical protein
MVPVRVAQFVGLIARACAGEAGSDRACLYKADYTRHIDHYIDFFGTGVRRDVATDPGLGSAA